MNTSLTESERRFRALFESSPDAVVVVEAGGALTDANAAFARLNLLAKASPGSPFDTLFGADATPAQREHLARALDGQTLSYELRAHAADGRALQLAVTLAPLGEPADGAIAVVRDVTAERESARRIREQERALEHVRQRAEIAVERLRDLYLIAASAEHSDAPLAATLELGCRAFSMQAGAVVDCTGAEPFIEVAHEATGSGELPAEALLSLAQSVFDGADSSAVVTLERGFGIGIAVGGKPFGAIAFVADRGVRAALEESDADLLKLMATLAGRAIERQRARARLRQTAYSDALTGLPNRVAMLERLHDGIEIAQSRGQRAAVLFLDLDRFKEVNETMGYAFGDRLLQMAAERLQREVGARGMVACLGGDEFLLLLPNCGGVDDVRDLSGRLLAILGEPFTLDEYEQFISASIGVAIYPEDGTDEQSLVKNADVAMYRAKDAGRNTAIFYNASLEASIHMRISQERLLRRALERDQFAVYYQPQLDLRTGRIVAAEALVRWNHPQSGLVEPARFIPSAEISGLIVPLGDWVLRTAARQTARWQSAFGPLRLAVNLSGRQFHQHDLRYQVLAALEDAALDPRLLEIEITESIAMSDAASTVAILSDLKNAGVRSAIDDFGTGYSSLGYLRRFDFDALKIDQTFVAGIGVQPSDETIVRTVVAMAHGLGIEVIAEGVENSAQMAFLREQGCELVQGYAVAPAVTAVEFEALLRRNAGGEPVAG